jgi:Icc-related predicted phosphoesterase
MKILVLGDVHGRFESLNRLINEKKPDIILQVGDFGYWPAKINFKKINNEKCKIYWCDGNHENHHKLMKIVDAVGERKPIEIINDVYYCPRGSILTLPDNRKVLFIGGAMSVDKILRTEGYNWFPEEEISEDDIKSLPDNVNIDIVISHTTPFKFIDKTNKRWSKIAGLDVSCKKLDKVYDIYKPGLWYSGHWHIYKKGHYNGCEWTILNRESAEKGWWEWL